MIRHTLTLIALLAVAGTATAGTFTVTLTNGTTFETRYRPVAVEWDADVVLINSDLGNPVALPRSEIADVTSSVEESGFGYQVNTTTVFVGWSPLDEPEEEGEEGSEGEDSGLPPAAFEPPEPSFTVEQFVNPGTAGAGSGLPAGVGF